MAIWHFDPLFTGRLVEPYLLDGSLSAKPIAICIRTLARRDDATCRTCFGLSFTAGDDDDEILRQLEGFGVKCECSLDRDFHASEAFRKKTSLDVT